LSGGVWGGRAQELALYSMDWGVIAVDFDLPLAPVALFVVPALAVVISPASSSVFLGEFEWLLG
jgi:hypothetical protein